MSTTELLTLLGVAITAATAIIVAVINLRQNSKIQIVHDLVNDRLEKAYAEIKRLQDLLRELAPELPL